MRLYLFISLLAFASCKKYLDKKPNASLVVPSSLSDLQKMLDENFTFNYSVYCGYGQEASDEHYLTFHDWSALSSANPKANYIWTPNPKNNGPWDNPYRAVLTANVILESAASLEGPIKNTIRGSALFFRAFSFFELAQAFTRPYDADSLLLPGLPLRLSSDYNTLSKRSTIGETYDRILTDLMEAKDLLDLTSAFKTRPNKVAAYAELSRVYLTMGDYAHALLYADSALNRQSDLYDYNELDGSSGFPFVPFGTEEIFYASAPSNTALVVPRGKIDTNLLALYDAHDMRPGLFFTPNGDGSFSFQGSYEGYGAYANVYRGLAVDELLLNRAECLLRTGDKEQALADLNRLLSKRYAPGYAPSYDSLNEEDLLARILLERRKELVFRGSRWMDLRRLNKDSRFAVTLYRDLNGTIYSLPPQSAGYTCLIPDEVIELTGMQQN